MACRYCSEHLKFPRRSKLCFKNYLLTWSKIVTIIRRAFNYHLKMKCLAYDLIIFSDTKLNFHSICLCETFLDWRRSKSIEKPPRIDFYRRASDSTGGFTISRPSMMALFHGKNVALDIGDIKSKVLQKVSQSLGKIRGFSVMHSNLVFSSTHTI